MPRSTEYFLHFSRGGSSAGVFILLRMGPTTQGPRGQRADLVPDGRARGNELADNIPVPDRES